MEWPCQLILRTRGWASCERTIPQNRAAVEVLIQEFAQTPWCTVSFDFKDLPRFVPKSPHPSTPPQAEPRTPHHPLAAKRSPRSAPRSSWDVPTTSTPRSPSTIQAGLGVRGTRRTLRTLRPDPWDGRWGPKPAKRMKPKGKGHSISSHAQVWMAGADLLVED